MFRIISKPFRPAGILFTEPRLFPRAAAGQAVSGSLSPNRIVTVLVALAAALPASAQTDRLSAEERSLTRSLQAADRSVTLARYDFGDEMKLIVRQQDGAATAIPFAGVALVRDPRRMNLTIRCATPGCIRRTSAGREAELDSIRWHFPLDLANGEAAARGYRSAAHWLGLHVGRRGGTVRDVEAAGGPASAPVPPGGDPLAVADARWTVLGRQDTMAVEMFAGSASDFWMRVRYTAPRIYDGRRYDTRYNHFAADCRAGQMRETRMMWALGGTAVSDSAYQARPTVPGPNSLGRLMLDRVCEAGRPPAGALPQGEIAQLLVLPESRWTDLGRTNAGATQHADFGSVANQGAHRLIWQRVRPAQPQPSAVGTYDTQLLHWALDCAAGQTRLTRLVVLHAGRVLADSAVALSWNQPRERTAGRAMLDRVCGAPAAGLTPPADVPASRWTAVTSGAAVTVAVALGSLSQQGEHRTAWDRMVLARPDTIGGVRVDRMYSQRRFDCRAARSQTLGVVGVLAGRTVHQRRIPEPSWSAVPPRSTAAVIMRQVCGAGTLATALRIPTPDHPGLTASQQRLLDSARVELQVALDSARIPEARGYALSRFVRSLPVAEFTYVETIAQIRALFERDFRSGFQGLMGTAPLDVARLEREATPERYRQCVRERAGWIASGRTTREPVCNVR